MASAVNYASELAASQLIIASPWWGMILREESGWLRRAKRIHAAVNTQALAFNHASGDILRIFVNSVPAKNDFVTAVARECAQSLNAMANVFTVISVFLKKILDGHDNVVMLESLSTNPFMVNIANLGELLGIARYECSCTAEFFEARFPLLQQAIQTQVVENQEL
jgi:hypothetical protein